MKNVDEIPNVADTVAMTSPVSLRLVFEERFTVMQSAGYYLQLMHALVSERPIEIDLSAVKRFDTAAMQLLLSFSLDAKRLGLPITWQTPSATVIEALALAAIDIEGLSGEHVNNKGVMTWP